MLAHQTEVHGLTSKSLTKFKRNYKPLAVAITLAMSTASHAATFTVTNTNDSGPGSLRQAVSDANGSSGADNIIFAPSLNGQNIVLTSGEIINLDDLVISGSISGDANSIIIDGNNASRIFRTSGNVVLENMTLTGGREELVSGGAILNIGTLTLNDTLITGNSANSGGGISSYGTVTVNRSRITFNVVDNFGGGIESYYGLRTTLNDSTVSNNRAGNGGGILSYYSDTNINNSTVSGNLSHRHGGGILSIRSRLNINQSTISGNSAGYSAGVYNHFSSLNIDQSTITSNRSTFSAGGISTRHSSSQNVRINNSIISGNSGLYGNVYIRPNSSVVNIENSLFGDDSSEINGINNANIFSNTPNLGSLSDNGGPTYTHLPNDISPALDAGNNTTVANSNDQRGSGFARIINGTVDIGAVERQVFDPGSVNLTLVKSITNDNGGSATLSNFVLTATGPTPISGISGSAEVSRVYIHSGTYTFTENTLPGYVQTSLQCIGSADTDPSDGLTLSSGEFVTCTFSNDDQPANLTLIKTVVNDHGGGAIDSDFTLTATGTDPSIPPVTGISGTPAVTNVEVNADTYTISEIALPGYLQSDIQCTGGSDTDLSNGLQLANGELVTCTITNDDQPATLTLLNTVINDDGGSATDSDWQLQAAGPVTINGIENEPVITSVDIPAGTYTLSVSNVAGMSSRQVIHYEATWECSGGQLNGNQLVLDLGETAVCTVTNNDIAPHAIPTLSLTGLLGLIASFAAFFGWRQRREVH